MKLRRSEDEISRVVAENSPGVRRQGTKQLERDTGDYESQVVARSWGQGPVESLHVMLRHLGLLF